MAEELQVIVRQEPGVVTWNFDQLKEHVGRVMAGYETIVYDDSAINGARKDLAYLRKLKTAVEDKRKEIRRKCLEPYSVIEHQARELTTLIDRPINAIDAQVKAYDESKRRERRETILAYMREVFSDLPEKISQKLRVQVYAQSWEAMSATKKTWTAAVAVAHDTAKKDLEMLAEVDPDFRDMAMKAYERNLKLSDALAKVNELQQQRENLRQKERERCEAEKREAALKSAEKQTPALAPVTTDPVKNELSVSANSVAAATELPAQNELPTPVSSSAAVDELTVRIKGDRTQIKKILAFIKYIGADYEVCK